MDSSGLVVGSAVTATYQRSAGARWRDCHSEAPTVSTMTAVATRASTAVPGSSKS